ncbi:MAG: DUF3667 domain-containing protein [Allomuricauda sp.]|nr:MAG: DUF3667 domain-containing protein [Allomuricauda sp.]
MGKKKEQGLIFTKGRYELKFRGTECLNCGHILDVDDKYCPNCGQANSTKRLVLRDFVDEFFSSLVNYDAKLLKTLYTMLLKPGTITKDYIYGKRISYTNPFRFLFSLAFLYFLMVTYGNDFRQLDDLNLKEKIKNEGDFNFSFGPNDFRDSLRQKDLPGLTIGNLDSLAAQDPEVGKGLDQLDSLDVLINKGVQEKKRTDSLMLADPKAFFATMKAKGDDSFSDKMNFFFNLIRKDSVTNLEQAQEKYAIDNDWSTRIAFNASKSAIRVISQPGSWIDDTMAKLPFVIFLFLPLFAIFIWVVYIRKNYTYTDHLIFSFHNQSLLFILLILSWIVDSIFGTTSVWIFILIFGFYLYKAMRRFYGQGRIKTIIKYLFLNTVFTFLALFTVLLIFTGSVFTY